MQRANFNNQKFAGKIYTPLAQDSGVLRPPQTM